MNSARAKAWKTRREKYGKRGHAGSYTRWNALSWGSNTDAFKRMVQAIAVLHNEAILSEGQACKIVGIDRVTFRGIAIEMEGKRINDLTR